MTLYSGRHRRVRFAARMAAAILGIVAVSLAAGATAAWACIQ